MNRRSIPMIVAGVAVTLFGVLFALSNRQFVPLYIPSVPWSPTPTAIGFEIRLFALLIIAAAIGAVTAVVFLRPVLQNLMKKNRLLTQSIAALEADNDRRHKLIELSRQKTNITITKE